MTRKSLSNLAAAACCLMFAVARADAQTPISACGTTISSPGPYVLTANLSNVGKNAPCITVNVVEVTIDLAGYTISGNGASYYGIWGASDLSVRNGTVRYFNVGVYAPYAFGVQLENLNLVANKEQGGVLGVNARVSGSLFRNNGSYGLETDKAALVTNSSFKSNGNDGIHTASGTLEDNVAYGNAADGLSGSAATTFIGNSASYNSGYGFYDGGLSTYQGNTAASNSLDGFSGGGSGSTYTGNSAGGNFGYGFNVACPDNLIGNTAYGNSSGPFNSAGTGCNKANNLNF